MVSAARLSLEAVPGIGLVAEGDDVARLILDAVAANQQVLQSGDILVVAQKIVSKAEGRVVELATVEPGAAARALAAEVDKDARLVELILRESRRVVRKRPGVLIVEHKLGFVMANAGIDQSNATPEGASPRAILLPEAPDRSAAALREKIGAASGVAVGVVISDSFGRAWRRGTAGVAIGAAGVPTVRDLRGQPDLHGRVLEVSITGFADEVAAAASLVMGQGAEGLPVVIVRGLDLDAPHQTAADIVRPAEEDLFR
jgi:coenzyme F420-0:L-glutamate ligase/coenzyme F420-1:gamma-L-glutamate ligase